MRASVVIAVVAGLAGAGPLAAQAKMPPKDEQIAVAVLPLPDELKPTARVMGYDAAGKFVVLREGKGMVCLAQYPKEEKFHVSCYQESLEPFMARGRELRADNTPREKVDEIRFAEAKSG
jgi:hypothetical protein